MWNTFQTGNRQHWMPQINVTESNALFLISPPPCAFVFLPKYRLLCYRWDYINGEHNTAGPHVHTLTIYYETLDRADLKSLLESLVLSRPRPQRWMATQVIKGIPLCFWMSGGCFPHRLLVSMCEFLWWDLGLSWKWRAAVMLALLSGERRAAAGWLIGFCLEGELLLWMRNTATNKLSHNYPGNKCKNFFLTLSGVEI